MSIPGALRSKTSRVTIQNPRPRKYASAAEKQAAFRARFPTICVRVEPKTADTIQKIGDASGRTQQETMLSLVKFALTNRDFVNLGLTEHKQLPRMDETRKANPMKKQPSAAQIAARERFAEMARSGTFTRSKGKRKAKPKQSSDKNAMISQMILERVESGESLKSAYDAVLGKGAYDRFAGELYSEIRKTKSNPAKKNPLTYGLDGVVNITDTYERSVASSRGLAEHYANQLRMRGRDDIVYVVFGITPEAKAQAGRLRRGVTITLNPRDYEIAYAFHPTRGEISRELKAQRDAERRAYTRQGMTLKRNPSDYRFEIRRANKAQTLDSVYTTLTQAKNALDEIDRPPASFFLVDTQTGKHYFSFQAETKLPMVELRATAMQKAYKRNPRASNPQARSAKAKGSIANPNYRYAVQAGKFYTPGQKTMSFVNVAGFPTKAQAQDYIDALLKAYPKGLTLRIMESKVE